MATAPAVIFAATCHYCSRQLSARDLIPIGDGGAVICPRCFEWHSKAAEKLETTHGCQECGLSLDDLAALSVDGKAHLFLVPKDGVYQSLCGPCRAAYEQKRADLLKATAYGHAQGIL